MTRTAGIAIFIAFAVGACASGGRQSNELAVVQGFLQAVAAEDMRAADTLLSGSAEFVLPFHPSGDVSAAAVRRIPAPVYLSSLFANYDQIVFAEQIAHIANEGRSVFLEAYGDFRVAGSGRPYRNRYLFRFDIYDGRIERITEYRNPVTAARDGDPRR